MESVAAGTWNVWIDWPLCVRVGIVFARHAHSVVACSSQRSASVKSSPGIGCRHSDGCLRCSAQWSNDPAISSADGRSDNQGRNSEGIRQSPPQERSSLNCAITAHQGSFRGTVSSFSVFLVSTPCEDSGRLAASQDATRRPVQAEEHSATTGMSNHGREPVRPTFRWSDGKVFHRRRTWFLLLLASI